MGIKGLTDLLAKHAPGAIKKLTMKELKGKKVAIDASVSIYQFLFAIRLHNGAQLSNGPGGDVTSHLSGTFYRTLAHLESGLIPTWVFDGKAPEMKGATLDKRAARRSASKEKEDAAVAVAAATEPGKALPSHPTAPLPSPASPLSPSPSLPAFPSSSPALSLFPSSLLFPSSSPPSSSPSSLDSQSASLLVETEAEARSESHQSRSQVRVSRAQNAEVQRLLKLMGVPVVLAPGEAEAQCAELARAGLVDAVGSEDLDTLAFGSPVLLRNLSLADKKKPITEFSLDEARSSLEMDMEQFIELCILLGCDYLPSIHGVGPVKALSLLRKHRTLAALIPHLQEMHDKKLADPKKSGGIVVPDGWDWEGAKAMFLRPDVLPKGDVPELTRTAPDLEGLLAYMVDEKGFSEDRIRKNAEKLHQYYIRDTM